MKPAFNRYQATIHVERLIGGIPVVTEEQRPDAYEAWARGQGVEPADASDLAHALADEGDMPIATEDVEGLMTSFRHDDGGLYIEARQVKAMLRESMQRLGFIKAKRGARQVLQHDLHVRSLEGDQRLYLLRAGERIHEPDGMITRPISVVTRQGPRTAMKRTDYCLDIDIDFQILILVGGIGDGILDEDAIRQAVEFGGWIGIGADRSQGEGVFDIRSFEAIPEVLS